MSARLTTFSFLSLTRVPAFVPETLAFHAGVTLGCYITLKYLDWYNSRKKSPTPPSGIRQQFRWEEIDRASL